MTKILIPRSDSISAKIIEPSDFEKLNSDDIVPDYKKSGFTLSAGSGLAVNVSSGVCRVKGLYLESSATETVSSLTASDVNYIYVKLARDSASEAESWDFDKNLTGVAPTDAFFIGTVTTDGSAVTAVDQTLVIDIAIPKFEYMYFGDGSDGDVTISSNTSINEVKRYDNLTINAGQTLTSTATSEATLIIQVRNTLTINGSISMNDKGGLGGDGGTAGTPETGGGSPWSWNGDAVAGGLGAGGNAGHKDTGSDAVELGTGGSGAGGRNPDVTTVTAGRKTAPPNIRFGIPFYIANSMPQIYGAGGSGGTGGNAGPHSISGGTGLGGYGALGGTGGKGGGGLIIMAKDIVFNSGATISANGQQGIVGGIGVNGACSNNSSNTNGVGGDGAGAGGGGEGGYIVVLYETIVNDGTMTVTAGASNIGGIGGRGDYNGLPICEGQDGGLGASAASFSSAAGTAGTTKLTQLLHTSG